MYVQHQEQQEMGVAPRKGCVSRNEKIKYDGIITGVAPRKGCVSRNPDRLMQSGNEIGLHPARGV